MSLKVSDLPALSVRRPTLVVVLNLLIIIAGVAALFGVEIRELPDVDRPTVTVRAYFDGAAPETMDAEVTRIIEGAVARVSGVKTINAASEENNCRVRAEFYPSVDLDVAANDVREAVAAIERDLPDGVDELTIVKADADASPIIRLALVSDRLSPEALTDLAENDISAELSAIPGVVAVELFGVQKRVLRVVINPMRLAGYGLSIDDVAGALRSTSLDVPAGSFKSDDQLLLVRADASVWNPAEIERLELKEGVKLSDVGNAFYGPADAESYSLFNGRRVVGLGIVRRAMSNTVAISDAVETSILRLNRRLKDAELVKISDDARFIRGSIKEVIQSLSIAVLVVITVIFVFMGRIGPTLVPAVAIPVALVGTIGAIWLAGFSINILTLLALVLATGMIVDDAIVVIENVERQRGLGHKAYAASVVGTRQVFFAVLATTATLISVFLPIAFLPSMAGRLFREFGFVLAFAVAISSFVALSLGPMLASRLPDRPGAGKGRQQKGLGAAISQGYRRLLEFTLTARLFIISAAIFAAVGAFEVYPTLERELLPKEDRGAVMIMMQGPDGVGLDYMDRQSAKAEALFEPLRETGEVENVYAVVGRWDPNRVFVMAPLADWSARTRSQQEIIKGLRGDLRAIPGASARFRTPNSLNLRRAGGNVEFALTGADYASIAAAADTFLEAMHERLPHLEDPEIEFQQTQPQLSVFVYRRRAEDLGVPVDGIVNTLKAMVGGFEVTELNVADRSIPVLLESTAGAIDDPSDLQNLFVAARDGRLVPLSSFVSLKEIGVAAELDRTAQSRAIEIDTPMPAGYSMQTVIDQIDGLADDVLPARVGLRFLNEAAALQDTSHDVAITFAIAVLVVLLVLAAQFESLLSALVIILTVPFGLAAAVFALKLTGTSINIYSQIGLVMLVGLMAKNGILVVEFADQLRDRGHSVAEAVREAAVTRLRPVIMTMLSTVLGALPLIIGEGAGFEARRAIGWVVFGGLGIATVFTLILIPVFYSLLASLAPARAHAGVRLDRELRDYESSADPAGLKPAE